MRNAILDAIPWLLIMVWVIAVVAGCSATPAPKSGFWGGLIGDTPDALVGTSTALSGLVMLAIAGIGIGFAAAYFLPGDDRLPYTVVIGCGIILGLSLFVQTSLPLLPWIVGAAFVGGIVWLVHRYWKKL